MTAGRERNYILSGLAAMFAAVFLGALATAVVFAADNEAAAMKLEKTEGTVSVTGSTGKTLSPRKDMRLYNGYRIGTEEESYAWISLDQSKLIKLDALSGAGIRKSGKKLEVLLESGNIFFNVTEPLEDEESLSIRTSTMAMGIRGTSGWVEVIDYRRTRVSVLEGTVQVGVADLLTGEVRKETVSAGETALCVVYGENDAGGWSAAIS